MLTHYKGVCQDFAHLLIAVLRCSGVPARYVSGYLHRPNKQSQSHAWCEAWLPDLGWVGVDPTNDCVADEMFGKVAIGRDFTDTPPNKGVYRGKATQSVSVRVETSQLDRLPLPTWEEQLPPPDARWCWSRRGRAASRRSRRRRSSSNRSDGPVPGKRPGRDAG